MTIDLFRLHLIIRNYTFVLAVILKFEPRNYTVGVNCA